jgi:hypothetical protein
MVAYVLQSWFDFIYRIGSRINILFFFLIIKFWFKIILNNEILLKLINILNFILDMEFDGKEFK